MINIKLVNDYHPKQQETKTTRTMEQQNQTVNQSSIVSYKDYVSDYLAASAPEKKVIPGTGGNTGKPEQNYHILPILYNYGSLDCLILNEFMLEGPELTSSLGVTSSPGHNNNQINYTLPTRFNLCDPEQVKFIDVMDKIYFDTAKLFHTHRVALRKPHFNCETPEVSDYKRPIYRPVDKSTGVVLEGRPPSMYFKLFKRGTPPMEQKTMFIDLNGQEIKWELLSGVEMRFIPLLHVKRIYLGSGAPSLQIELFSAVVKSVQSRGSIIKQQQTINRLRSDDPNLVDVLSAQLSALTAERLGGNIPSSVSTATPGATFEGIDPITLPSNVQTNTPPVQVNPVQQQQASPQATTPFKSQTVGPFAPTLGAVPPIPVFDQQQTPGSATSITDLTSTAPVRNETPSSPAVGQFNLS